MSDAIETISYKGYDIEIFYDEEPQSPDYWKNDERFIVFDHRQFYVQREGFDPTKIFNDCFRKQKPIFDGYFIFPLFAHIHSGVVLSLAHDGDRWDTSFKGFALVKRVKGTWKKEKARKQAVSLVECWNGYLTESHYGYESEVGSCCGFQGEEGKKEMISEAKAEIDYVIDVLINKSVLEYETRNLIFH